MADTVHKTSAEQPIGKIQPDRESLVRDRFLLDMIHLGLYVFSVVKQAESCKIMPDVLTPVQGCQNATHLEDFISPFFVKIAILFSSDSDRLHRSQWTG